MFHDYNLTKVSTLYDLAKANNASMICLTESHLYDRINDFEISSDGWTILRSDRSNRLGGGVVNMIKSEFLINSKFSYSNSYCETLCVHIKLINLISVTIYRPPQCPADLFIEVIDKIEEWINQIENDGDRPILLINGDFNLPFMGIWDEENVTSLMNLYTEKTENGRNISSDKKQAMRLCEFSNSHFLHQFIDTPTRMNNTLDLIFSNDDNLICDYENIVNMALSDHNTLVINTNIELSETKVNEHKNIYYSKIPEFNLQDVTEDEWNIINEKLYNINWDLKFEDKDPDEITKILIEIIENVIQ